MVRRFWVAAGIAGAAGAVLQIVYLIFNEGCSGHYQHSGCPVPSRFFAKGGSRKCRRHAGLIACPQQNHVAHAASRPTLAKNARMGHPQWEWCTQRSLKGGPPARPREGRLCGCERDRDISTVVVHMRLSPAFSFSRTLSRTFLPTAMSGEIEDIVDS